MAEIKLYCGLIAIVDSADLPLVLGRTWYAFRSKPWRAAIGKEQTFLGFFASAEEAAHAYDNAAIARYGEFARLNFPPK